MNEDIRKTGQTTRIVDQAIQDLFTNGEVIITDHTDFIKYPQMRMCTLDIVIRRLKLEHEYTYQSIKVDRKKYRIYFLK